MVMKKNLSSLTRSLPLPVPLFRILSSKCSFKPNPLKYPNRTNAFLSFPYNHLSNNKNILTAVYAGMRCPVLSQLVLLLPFQLRITHHSLRIVFDSRTNCSNSLGGGSCRTRC